MSAAPYDEAGAAEAGRDHLQAALAGADLAALKGGAQRHMAELGASFGAGAAADAFRIDPVPRMIDADDWARLEAGLDQRVRALNAFVVDAYGPRDIVEAGVLADAVIELAEGYEPVLRGRLPPGVVPIGIAGLDVVREPGGAFQVLEDNCRAPSGFAYAAAVRDATEAVLPLPGLGRREVAGPVAELIGAVLRDATPAGVEDPHVVVLTDGPRNVAYWEHARLAELAGAALRTCLQVERHGDVLLDRDGRRVDVLYRRCDEDRMRKDDGSPTLLAELVTEPWLAGTLGLVNGLGSGVADDKLVHAHVEAMVRFYLGEEPRLASVPTLDLGDPASLAEVLARLEEHVIKPRGGYGGHGVVIGSLASTAELEAVRAELVAKPERYIAQRTVTLSSAPTIVERDGGVVLAPRHVDLRPYTFSGRGWTRTLPGGLTRVALREGALVVNSSQDGGAKDTWVLT